MDEQKNKTGKSEPVFQNIHMGECDKTPVQCWIPFTGKYKYFLEEPLLTEDLVGTREENIKATAEFYTKAVEKYVKLFPEQWLWMHKRWKTRPEE